MRSLILIAFALSCSFSFAQKLKFKVAGQKDTTVHLVKYFGKGLYYADTAEMKGGYVEFDGSKQQAGILGLLMPGQKFFEFVYNQEEIHMETSGASGPEYITNMKVKKSEENKVFIDYVRYIQEKKSEAAKNTDERSKLTESEPKYKSLTAKIDSLNKLVLYYQNNLIKSNPGKLVSKIVYMSMDIDIPEPPKDEKGNLIDSNFR